MGEKSIKLSTSFKVRQIAGSCRLESIAVSKDDELLMAKIVDGEIDGAVYRQHLVEKYKAINSKRLADT